MPKLKAFAVIALALLTLGCRTAQVSDTEGQIYTWETCPVEEPTRGVIELGEYANFFPDQCPGIAMQILRFARSNDAELYRQILIEDPESGNQVARVSIRASRVYRDGFRYIIVTSLEVPETLGVPRGQ